VSDALKSHFATAVGLLEITVFRKVDGPLTKRIALGQDGALLSDGSACVMSRGIAWRFGFDRLGEFVQLIERFGPDQAIALGGLRPDLPDQVEVVTKRKLNGTTDPNVIARSRDYIIYRPGEFALALVDYDTKGMPPASSAGLVNWEASGPLSCQLFLSSPQWHVWRANQPVLGYPE
jgi:hypothetical protein